MPLGFSPPRQLDARAHLVEALRYDLVGPMQDDELIELRPTRWYLTGFLVPKGAGEDLGQDPLESEELSAGLGSDRDDDAGGQDPSASRPGWFPSSFGLTVLVPVEATALAVALRWGEYQRLDDVASLALWAEHQPKQLETRQRPRRPVDGAEPEGEAALRAPPPLWRRRACTAQMAAVPLRTGHHPVSGAPGLLLHIRVVEARAPGLPVGTRAVSVFLVNA